MQTEEKELSPQQSLDLIRSMIDHTRGAVADNSFYFLLWGWLVFGCSVLQYLLKTYDITPYHYAVWWCMPIGGVISGIYGSRQSKKVRVKSFIDDAMNFVWLGIAFSFLALLIINILNTEGWRTAFTYYILLYAIGTFVTGSLIRFKPLIIGGVINFALAIISIKLNYDGQLMIGAFAVLISYIIPGHLLRLRYKKQNR
jgi:hypothetical protein